MRQINRLAALAAVAAMPMSIRVADEIAATPTPLAPRPAPSPHKHAREIARRLRQEARKAAKQPK